MTRLILFSAILWLSACVSTGSDALPDGSSNGSVNVYTHRHYEIDQEIFNRFESETGIQVNVVKASADELIVRLENEGEKSPADLLVTVDAGRLVLARDKVLLQSIESTVLSENIPAYLRDPEGYWFGQTMRARVLVYAKDRVNLEDLSTYEALTDSRWKGRILSRSSSNIYNQSLLASIIAHHGSESAEQWAKGVLANFSRKPKGNDRDQIVALTANQGDIAIVNSYYLGKLLESDDPGQRAAAEAVGVFFPNQNDRGSHINISGAGVTKHAPNRDNAIRLLEFLSSPDIQSLFASANAEYPVNPHASQSELLNSWGDFKRDTLNLRVLGTLNSEAVEIFDRVGWK